MPIYEFACDKCGKVIERLADRSRDVIVAGCPDCGGNLTVVPSVPGLVKLKTPPYGVL